MTPECWEPEAGRSLILAKPGQFGDLEAVSNYKKGWDVPQCLGTEFKPQQHPPKKPQCFYSFIKYYKISKISMAIWKHLTEGKFLWG